MNERRSPGPMIVSPPRVGDAIGAALRNVFRGCEAKSTDWDDYLRRIDRADLNRRG